MPLVPPMPPGVKVQQKLATGSFAVVYSGLIYGTPCAFRRTGSTKDATRTLHILTHYQHPNIIRLLAVFPLPGGSVVFALELCKGDLFDLCFGSDAPCANPTLATRVARDIYAALEFLHMASLVHLDVKPENILVAAREFKLTDFGFTQPERTILVKPVGTAQYLPAYADLEAPYKVERTADMYALALVCAELTTGVPLKTRQQQSRLLMEAMRTPNAQWISDPATGDGYRK